MDDIQRAIKWIETYQQSKLFIAEIIRSHMTDEPVSNPYKLNDRWIPVRMKDEEWTAESELPKENQNVWVTVCGRVRKSVFRNDSFWECKDIAYDPIVEAWMPRYEPEPYQPEKGGAENEIN